MDLNQQVQQFASKWGPSSDEQFQRFVTDLRALLESYGRAALLHQSFPDTEHEHGDPI